MTFEKPDGDSKFLLLDDAERERAMTELDDIFDWLSDHGSAPQAEVGSSDIEVVKILDLRDRYGAEQFETLFTPEVLRRVCGVVALYVGAFPATSTGQEATLFEYRTRLVQKLLAALPENVLRTSSPGLLAMGDMAVQKVALMRGEQAEKSREDHTELMRTMIAEFDQDPEAFRTRHFPEADIERVREWVEQQRKTV